MRQKRYLLGKREQADASSRQIAKVAWSHSKRGKKPAMQ